jgi:hypothetical protein
MAKRSPQGDSPQSRRKWPAETVIAALQKWHTQGRRIRSLKREHPSLYHAMRRRFGSCDAALEAAGIDEGRRWTPQRVIERLQRYDRAPSGPEAGAALANAAFRLFGSWNEALCAAGFEPRHKIRLPRRVWTRQSVLRAIQQPSEGRDESEQQRLSSAAVRHFGSYANARAAAGIAKPTQRVWTYHSVLEHLRRLKELGHFQDNTRIDDRRFVHAAERWFGCWSGALQAAGILPVGRHGRRIKFWTHRRVVQSIQDLYVSQRPLTYLANRRLYVAAVARFGSWHAALTEAGVPEAVWPPQKKERKRRDR